MRRFRNRPLQATSLLLLSAILVAFVAFAPLFDRAMQREVTARQLAQAPGHVTGLKLASTTVADLRAPDGVRTALSLEDLEGLVPRAILPFYGEAVRGYAADATVELGPLRSAGRLVGQPGQCELITISGGSCPDRPGEILVSDADREVLGVRVGDRVRVSGTDLEELPDGSREQVARSVGLTVTGSYDASGWSAPDDRWAGQRLAGLSGTTDPGPPARTFHDAWITDPGTFTTDEGPAPAAQQSYVALSLDQQAVGPDEVALLAGGIEQLRAAADLRDDADIAIEAGIGEVAATVDAQTDQARITVPLLMVQLALLSLVVLWLALRAAGEERRPEVALVRLRGRGRRGVRRFVVAELMPIVLAGVPLGAVLAVLGCALLQRTLLSADDTLPELDLRLVIALAVASSMLIGAVLLTARRMSREPLADLFRRVPARRSRFGLGVVAAVVVSAAGSALVAIVAGDTSGPVALAVPALLAVVVGVVLAHLIGPAIGLLGRRLLSAGRLVGSIALLDTARSGAAARTVAMVTVAAGLAVFSANALVVGHRNWTAAAAQGAGAAVVVPALGGSVAQLRAAAAEADASGDHVTPVVRITSPGTDAANTLAVLPSAFAGVALFPGGPPDVAAWESLALPDAEPVRFTGRGARIGLAVDDLRASERGGGSVPVELSLTLRTDSVTERSISIADDLSVDSTTRVDLELPCEDGCTLTGLRLLTVPGSVMRGSLTLTDLVVDGTRVSLDPTGGWHRTRSPDLTIGARAVDDGLRVQVQSDGPASVELTPRWLPASVPVLTTEALGDDPAGDTGSVRGLDGITVPATVSGSVKTVPASGDRTVVANLEALERIAPGSPDAAMEVWLDSPSRLGAVERALTDRGLLLGDVRTLTGIERDLRSTTAAWSLQLALVVGVLGLLVAALALLVVAVAGWRTGGRDLAALRLGGMSADGVRRLAVLAQLPAIVVGVLAGTVTGVLGAAVALPIVPLFATDPEVSLLDLDTVWWAVAGASGIALVVLAGTGAVAGLGLARRARTDRVRDAL